MIPTATDEVLKLRKELRLREAEHSKEKAILTQKIEQLEHSLKDSKEREEAQKKMHETMMNCLNSGGEGNQAMLQIQAIEKQAQSQIEELQNHKRRLQEELEYKDHKEKELRQLVTEKDLQIKDIQIEVERLQSDKRYLVSQQEQEKKEFQSKVTQIQNEREQAVQKVEFKWQQTVNDLKVQIETLKLEHQREIEKLKSDCEQSLKEIKYFHDQEKLNLQHRVDRSTNELSSLIHMVKQRDAAQDLDETRHEQIKRKREELEIEISMLYNEVEQIKRAHETTIAQVQKEKSILEAKNQKLSKQLEKIKNAPKPVKIDLSSMVEKQNTDQESKANQNLKNEIDSLVKENERLDEQIKKLRKEKIDCQDYIDQVELKLRQLQKEKNQNDIDHDKVVDLRRQLNAEKKRNIELQDNINSLRDTIETMENDHSNKLLEKDQKLNKLYKELRETEKKLIDIQSVFNSDKNHITHQRNPSPFTIGNDQISQIHNRNISYSPISYIDDKRPLYKQGSISSNKQLSPRAINQSALICAPIQEGTMNMKTISQVDYTLLKICQRMADNALRMECSTCMHLIETADFYDHLNSQHPQINKSQVQNQPASNNQQYNTNKHMNVSKRYQEDLRSSSHAHNILETSPKVKPTQKQITNPQQKWIKSSRSFTCLLNEIEEEEKVNNSSVQQPVQPTGQGKRRSSKSPMNFNETTQLQTKSRNLERPENNPMSTLQLSTLGSGNTLQSVLRSQKDTKKLKHNMSSSRILNPTSVIINTAQRTEIQNLKRENKKLSHKLKEQESKINDVSRDCSMIKKQVQIEKQSNQTTHLTNEIKGLLEKLVSYQGQGKETKEYGTLKTGTNSGAFTSRKHSNLPMSTDSLVELKSNVNHKKKNKKSYHQHKDSKSPLPQAGQYSARPQHQSNKENIKTYHKQSSSTNLHKVSKHSNLNTQRANQEDKRHSSSSNEIKDTSMITTERRYHQVKKSDQLCSNSPTRYQNYFEILSNEADSQYQQLARQKQPRYSPSHNSSLQSKVTSGKSQQRLNELDHQSRNQNMPVQMSKGLQQQYTICSSQNGLVLYDSQHTELFKSKNLANLLKKDTNNQSNVRRLDFENQNFSNLDDIDGLHPMPSSCPSLDEYEEGQFVKNMHGYTGDGIFNSSLDEDPFITGRFCDNGGHSKQFLFKQYSNNNSKNSTMRTNFLNQ